MKYNKLDILGLVSAISFGGATGYFTDSFLEFVLIYFLGALWSLSWFLRLQEVRKEMVKNV